MKQESKTLKVVGLISVISVLLIIFILVESYSQEEKPLLKIEEEKKRSYEKITQTREKMKLEIAPLIEKIELMEKNPEIEGFDYFFKGSLIRVYFHPFQTNKPIIIVNNFGAFSVRDWI